MLTVHFNKILRSLLGGEGGEGYCRRVFHQIYHVNASKTINKNLLIDLFRPSVRLDMSVVISQRVHYIDPI